MVSLLKDFKFLLIMIVSIILSGCTDIVDSECLEAEDFGFVTVTVPAKYGNAKSLRGNEDNQIGPWRGVGYPLSGSNLVIKVKNWDSGDEMTKGNLSAWCPWYGGRSKVSGIAAIFDPLALPFKNALTYICRRLAPCKWANNDMCTPSANGDAAIINAPCLMTKGVGLYGLMTAYDIGDPNAKTESMSNPEGFYPGGSVHTMHLGEKHDNYTLFDIDSGGHYSPAGGIVYSFTDEEVGKFRGGKLYFKILDKHYGDNSGQYIAVIKSGLDASYAIDPFK